MRKLFITNNHVCNDCHLTELIPQLVADELLGTENLPLLKERYQQMRNGYNLTYLEWRDVFTDKLKPFCEEWDDTTAVTIPIKHKLFKQDFERIAKALSDWIYLLGLTLKRIILESCSSFKTH